MPCCHQRPSGERQPVFDASTDKKRGVIHKGLLRLIQPQVSRRVRVTYVVEAFAVALRQPVLQLRDLRSRESRSITQQPAERSSGTAPAAWLK